MNNEKDPTDIESEPDSPISPFSPYHELLVNIRLSLTSTRKESTHVRVKTFIHCTTLSHVQFYCSGGDHMMSEKGNNSTNYISTCVLSMTLRLLVV